MVLKKKWFRQVSGFANIPANLPYSHTNNILYPPNALNLA